MELERPDQPHDPLELGDLLLHHTLSPRTLAHIHARGHTHTHTTSSSFAVAHPTAYKIYKTEAIVDTLSLISYLILSATGSTYG